MEKSKVIIIIDMLKDFLEPNHPLFCGDEAKKIIPCVVDLLSKHKGADILYICDRHDRDDPEFKMFPPHSVKGTQGTEIIDELKPFKGTIIPKTTFSTFYRTNTEEMLDRIKPDQVIVSGVCTDICVLYTAVDLRIRGYEVIVPSACVASFDPNGHKWALQHMEKVLGVHVI